MRITALEGILESTTPSVEETLSIVLARLKADLAVETDPIEKFGIAQRIEMVESILDLRNW